MRRCDQTYPSIGPRRLKQMQSFLSKHLLPSGDVSVIPSDAADDASELSPSLAAMAVE